MAQIVSRRTRATPPSFNEIRIADARFDVVLRTLSPDPDTVLPREPVSQGAA